MIEDKIKFLQARVKVFHSLQEEVHVVLTTGHWMNGFIVEESADFFMMQDRRDGLVPVFYQQVSTVNKFSVKKEGKDGI